MVARSRAATGPFETLAQATGASQSVILERSADWNAPGHNSVVRDARGDAWLFYHAIDARRSRGAPSAATDGRRVLLADRLIFRNGWPAIARGQPSSAPQPAPLAP
jgi:arabinan endo-1,5-alpha-L-arabinosidase